MSEPIRTVQWNIGGGKIRDPESVISDEPPYDHDGLEAIIDTLEQSKPDIITLQETHGANGFNQAAVISEAIGLPYYVNDYYGESHIDPDYQLGQAIISRFPLTGHDFRLFINPGYTADWATRTHDKGVTSVRAHLGNRATVLAQTLHAVPFRAFGVDQASERARPVLDDMEATVLATSHRPRVLQGDFNLHGSSLASLLPTLFRNGFDEIIQDNETTPRGRIYDHVMFSGFTVLETTVVKSVLTDHFPVVTTLAQK